MGYDKTDSTLVTGKLVRILLRVRRFFCGNPGCRSKTFVEQVDGLTRRWSRMSEGLRRMLTTIGLALAGRAGARLATTLGMPTGRDRLLRLVRALPDPPVSDITVLGVDDFAIKRRDTGQILGRCPESAASPPAGTPTSPRSPPA